MSDKRPLGSAGFTNRRGHNTDVSAQELEGLSIDDQPVSREKADPTLLKSKNPKKPRTRRHVTWSRKKTIITAAIVVVVIAIPVLLGELLRAQYLASAGSAQSSMHAIITGDVLPMQKKSDITSKQVSAVTDKLETVRDSMCPGGLLDNMAMLYPRAKDAHQKCIDGRGKIASLVTQLRDMVAMLGYIETLNAALAPVSASSSDAFAVIATQQSNWQQLNEKLVKMNAPTSLKTANDQLVSAVKSITGGWSKLNVANNAQNATDFQAAERQLADGYSAVRASKDAFATAIATKQATISTLSRQLEK